MPTVAKTALSDFFLYLLGTHDALRAAIQRTDPDTPARYSAIAKVDQNRLNELHLAANSEARARNDAVVVSPALDSLKRSFDVVLEAAVTEPSGSKRLFDAQTALLNAMNHIKVYFNISDTRTLDRVAVRLGNGKYQVGGEAPFVLQESEDTVLQALIELGGAATKGQLVDRSGKTDAPRILRTIIEKYEALAQCIILPKGKGKGGYRTTIKPAI